MSKLKNFGDKISNYRAHVYGSRLSNVRRPVSTLHLLHELSSWKNEATLLCSLYVFSFHSG